MSFFSRILEKLGMRKPEVSSHGSQGTPSPSRSGGQMSSGGQRQSNADRSARQQSAAPTPAQKQAAAPRAEATSAARPTPVAMVDVVSHLEALAANNSQKLNWRTSIVDLLKLLDIDSSLEARKELADELGAPADLKDGSVEMNTWLHRSVLRKIAENGGNVPKQLLE